MRLGKHVKHLTQEESVQPSDICIIYNGKKLNALIYTLDKLDSLTLRLAERSQAPYRNWLSKPEKKDNSHYPIDVSMAATILACVKYQSPIPPEYWRRICFPLPQEEEKKSKKVRKKK